MALTYVTDGARERQELRARVKVIGLSCNTYGFAALGGSLAGLFLDGDAFTIWHGVGTTLGIVLHGLAIWFAPMGDPDAH